MNVIANFIGQIVQVFYAFTGDYGIAIVMITLAIKLLLLPLNVKQRAQLEKQKEVNQKVAEIQKKYANNQNKMNEELQRVYAENGLGSMGCLSTLIQMPIMIGLYHGIRNVITEDVTSVLLPWIPSLLLSDATGILPIGTLILQMLPMLFPYMPCFEKKQLQKTPMGTIIMLLVMNGMFVFVIPSGVGLYYFVSSLFTVVEQFIFHLKSMQNH
ncbi:MAG: membrane protein insertase YidC [Agathobacter sp.]|nr:membrane protein insertase YidC [Agathobacter sp.]